MESCTDSGRLQRTPGSTGRYVAQRGNPHTCYDTLKDKVSSEHLTYGSAVARAYCLNRFSTGLKIGAVLAFACLSAKAQQPDTTIHFSDYAAYAGIGTYRTLDYFSTRRGLALGGHEEILPNFVAKNAPVLAAFEGLATAGEVAGSVYLIRHGHRKLARFENYVSIGVGSVTVARNYSIGGAK
jgi:hypothetical protein